MYCVKCGVELHQTAEKCVLCDTKVVDPKILDNPKVIDIIENINENTNMNENAKKTSLREKPKPYGHIGTRVRPPSYIVAYTLIGILLAIDSTCLVIQTIYTPDVPWSYIVLSSSILILILILYPMLSKGLSGYIYSTGIGIGIALILLSSSLFTENTDWLLSLALPLLMIVVIEIYVFITVKRYLIKGILPLVFVALLLLPIMIICCEGLINNLIYGRVYFEWSLILVSLCGTMGVLVLFILLNEKIRGVIRKFFHL